MKYQVEAVTIYLCLKVNKPLLYDIMWYLYKGGHPPWLKLPEIDLAALASA